MTSQDPDVGASLPEPADEEVALLLQSVWDLLATGEHWPKYRAVDRQLYRERQLDVDVVISRTPETLLLGGRPTGGARPNADAQLSLTAAGAAACTGSDLALEVLVAAARLAGEAELRTMPDWQDPMLRFEEVAATAGVRVTGEHAQKIARQSGLLLHAEPWTGHILLHQGGWQLTVDRRARPYSNVTDLPRYWALREHQRLESVASQPLVPSVETAPGDVERVLQLQRRWTVGQQLGSGGFGQVFGGTGEDGALAAVKFVPKVPGAERELLFAELDGVRNVVPVIDAGEVNDAWVLVMPRAQQSLQDRLDDAVQLPLDDALPVLRDVATALTDLAARGEPIVHRDIKPANVLLLDGAWCLADFGISRYAEASTAPDTRKLAWSPPYTAPERWRTERATAAADVYAVGVMAFQLLTGSLPFMGPALEDYRDQHLHDEPPALQGVSARLVALVAECLQKAPQARPGPDALLGRLERASSAEQSPGVGALAIAYQHQVGEVAAAAAAGSRVHSEEQRREELGTAASRSLDTVSEQLFEVVLDAAPGLKVERRAETKWTVQLGSTRFGLSAASPFDGRDWGGWNSPGFDVVAFATITVVIATDAYATRAAATRSTTATPSAQAPTLGTRPPSCTTRSGASARARTRSPFRPGGSRRRRCGPARVSTRSHGPSASSSWASSRTSSTGGRGGSPLASRVGCRTRARCPSARRKGPGDAGSRTADRIHRLSCHGPPHEHGPMSRSDGRRAHAWLTAPASLTA